MSFELSALGWNSFFDEQWNRFGSTGLIPGRVAAEHRGGYDVWSSEGEGLARLTGRLRHELDETRRPTVGDWVALDVHPRVGQDARIHHVLERRTAFIRGAAGRESVGQVVASNVDLVFVVCGLDEDFNVRRIERYVARVRASGASPVVVLAKADLVSDPSESVDEVRRHAPDVEVEAISALEGQGVAAIRARLRVGITAALVGSSGAGKSTLANALLDDQQMATGSVRASDGRGRHTTTHRQLLLVPGGGLLLDTPGMRELQLFDEQGLEQVFDEVAALAGECRFADCSHGAEPGCALRDAVEAGALDSERFEHFLQLQREARAYERRHDARLRRADERAWGKISREAHKRMRAKRGE
jgi:ribosome biogenesis GTPase